MQIKKEKSAKMGEKKLRIPKILCNFAAL